MTSRPWASVRLGCAACSFAAFAVAVTIIGLLTPGYNQWSDPVSRLASSGEPWALEAQAAFAVYGLMIVAGAGTVRPHLRRHGNWLTLGLVLYGLACITAGLAPKNQPGTTRTFVSQVHVSAAILAGALLLGAMILVARFGATAAVRRSSFVLAILTGLTAVAFRFMWGTHLYGVSERLLLGLGMGWLSALAATAFGGSDSPVTVCS